MKKKLGDLTIREINEICWSKEKCSECPLSRAISKTYYECKADFTDRDNKQFLDQEIEVEE